MQLRSLTGRLRSRRGDKSEIMFVSDLLVSRYFPGTRLARERVVWAETGVFRATYAESWPHHHLDQHGKPSRLPIDVLSAGRKLIKHKSLGGPVVRATSLLPLVCPQRSTHKGCTVSIRSAEACGTQLTVSVKVADAVVCAASLPVPVTVMV